MDIGQIMDILPHRYPFLLIDRVLELQPGQRAVATKNVTINEPFFGGHFPGQPVMPGVLIIEALAQTGACALLSLEENRGRIAFFGGIRKARFRRKVVPGDVLRLEVDIKNSRDNIGMGTGKAYVGDELACDCELSFAVETANE